MAQVGGQPNKAPRQPSVLQPLSHGVYAYTLSHGLCQLNILATEGQRASVREELLLREAPQQRCGLDRALGALHPARGLAVRVVGQIGPDELLVSRQLRAIICVRHVVQRVAARTALDEQRGLPVRSPRSV